MYYVYLVKCADQTLYCGYTTNLQTRINNHNHSKTGAKYTKSRRPVELVYFEEYQTKSQALKREYEIKQLTLAEKRKLYIKNQPLKIIC